MSLNAQYIIESGLQEYFVDKSSGLPLSNGTITYYSDTARSTLKAVYTLSGSPGSYTYTQIENPVPLSGVGTATDGSDNDIPIYLFPYDVDGVVELYYVVVKDSDGLIQFSRQAWPNITQEIVNDNIVYNFVRNPTFYGWGNSTDYINIGLGSSSFTDFVCDDWSYHQDDSSQTIEVSRGTFIPGDNTVSGNPPFYLLYENSNAGSMLSTFNRFRQYYKSVQTLNDNDVSVSIWVNQISGSSSQFSVTLTQFYGTGGSPSPTGSPIAIVVVPVLTIGTWTQYIGTAFVPSIFGKTLGTNGDDALILSLNMPLNKTCKVAISSVQLELGTSISNMTEMSNDDHLRYTNTMGLYPIFTAGDAKLTLKIFADPGWIITNDSTLGSSGSTATNKGLQYKALFKLLWQNISDTYAPVIGGRGASAEADFNANKSIYLTKTVGRVLACAGQAALALTFTADTVTERLALSDSSSFYTGTPITVSTTGTLPAPLLVATTYYVINIDATHIELATTLANAIAGTPINITTTGTGVHTITIDYSSWAYGAYIGQESHSSTVPEIGIHKHAPSDGDTFVTHAAPGGLGLAAGGGENITQTFTANTGSSAAFNIMQPTSFWNFMIKL